MDSFFDFFRSVGSEVGVLIGAAILGLFYLALMGIITEYVGRGLIGILRTLGIQNYGIEDFIKSHSDLIVLAIIFISLFLWMFLK